MKINNVTLAYRTLLTIVVIMGIRFPVPVQGEDSLKPNDQAESITIEGVTGPKAVTIRSGNLLLRIDGPKLWTPSGLDYRGTIMGIEDSSYGSVFNITGVGFIGAAHREVETEQIQSLRFFVDDQLVEKPAAEIIAKTFRVERKSKIRDFELSSIVSVENERFSETAEIKASRAVHLYRLYHFMHAWSTTTSEYLYGRDDGTCEEGILDDAKESDRKFFIGRDMNWVATYSARDQKGSVSRLQERPKEGDLYMQIWNVPTAYRKFYLVAFAEEEVPAGFHGKYRMVTAFFESPADQWQRTAKALAESIREAK